MGIADRDYIRDQPPPRSRFGGGFGGFGGGVGGGFGGWRLWSVTTWLIIICIAVFIIDVFLPVQWVPMEMVPNAGISAEVLNDPDQLEFGPINTRQGIRGVYLRGAATPGGQAIPVGIQHMYPMPLLEAIGHFSTQRGFMDFQFWRIITFQFLHDHRTIAHLLFNMIGLYFFGPIVERHLGRKRYLAFYLLCGIFGALLYTLLNLAGIIAHNYFNIGNIPGLLFNQATTPLIGASAGVFGILMAGAYLVPNATVYLFFILPMRFVWLAWGLLAVAFFNLITGADNAGGEAGHLGGAIAGYYFIRHPHHLHNFFDILGRVDPTSHHYRGPNEQTAARQSQTAAARRQARDPRNPRSPRSPRSSRSSARESREVDRILDKINREGLNSLTEKEKRILRESSR